MYQCSKCDLSHGFNTYVTEDIFGSLYESEHIFMGEEQLSFIFHMHYIQKKIKNKKNWDPNFEDQAL